MKKNKILVISVSILVLLALVCIFGNSFTGKVVSNARSNYIAQKIASVVAPTDDPELMKAEVKYWNQIVRKVAHGVEFFLLGICLSMVLLYIYKRTGRLHISWYLFAALFIGVMDEYIQTFTGRTSRVRDVLIDFSGAVTGLLVTCLVFWLIKRRKNK